MIKKLKQFFSYELIKKVQSPINGAIKVVHVFNKPRLIIGNMVQSGGMVKQIWEKAVLKFKQDNPRTQPKNILIIGFGCGDCAFSLQQHFPQTKITGIEIDEHIIDMAKSYFNLASVKNLNIVITDGTQYVAKKAKLKKPQKYDLVIIDVYLGKKMPKPFKTKKFFNNLTKLLNQDGIIIFNHLFFKHHKQKVKEFITTLESFFSNISLQRTATNLLIFLKK